MSRPAASVSGSGRMSGTEQVPGRAASRGSLPGKKLVFQQRAAIPRVRMAGFSHEPLKTVRMIRSAKRGVTGCSTPWNPAFHTNYPTTTLIQAATNKSELFNKYAQWVAFGESGLVSEGVRDEQRKLIKYNHLVANLLIFHTIVDMTRGLERMAAEGLPVDEAALASP